VTTVAALAVGGAVCMAADTGTSVYDRPVAGARKIRRHPVGDGQVLLGYCGSGGIPEEVAAHLKLDREPERDATEDNIRAWAHAVAAAISDVARDAGLVDDGKLDARILLGWRGRLWTLTHHMSIPHPDGIATLGSGEGPAIGALDALMRGKAEPTSMWCRAAVHEAVEIAIARDQYSMAPVQVETLEPLT
jgi:ATP-dependent protease HslVU (ClpYQ) peptidase subunit